MSEDNEFLFGDAPTVPIPPAFHSLETDGPFDACLRCSRPLLGGDEMYMIERAFKRDEPIIEYAICMKCAGNSTTELSEESRLAIQQWFQQRLDPMARFDLLMDATEAEDGHPLFGQCAITGLPAGDCEERQIMAMCKGDRMLLNPSSPMMLSAAVMEEIVGILSEKTKGWMQDFVGDNFGMPPEFCDNPDLLPLLI